MSKKIISSEAAKYLSDVADALNSVKSGTVSYGEYYVVRAEVHFDGDPTGYAIEADEHGTYSVVVE